jgi:competence protein ComEA
MLKKASFILVRRFCFILFMVLISAAFTLEVSAAPAKAPAAAADVQKAAQDVKAAAKSAPVAATTSAPTTKININTADKAILEKLTGIGPVKAQAIIDGRPYKTIEDVMRVSGIKGKTFEGIKDYIAVK